VTNYYDDPSGWLGMPVVHFQRRMTCSELALVVSDN
jgi:hypothetical protein